MRMVRSSPNREPRAWAFDPLQHAGTKLKGRIRRVTVDDGLQSCLFERLTLRVFRFRDAVAVENEHFARSDVRLHRAEHRFLEHAERHAGCGQPFETAVHASDERWVLAGVDVGERSGRRVVDAIEQRDEARSGSVPADLDVQPLDEGGGLHPLLNERAQAGEQQGHEQRGRTALAGDVAERHDDSAVGEWQDIVEISADGVGGSSHAADFDIADGECPSREQGQLDLARHFQLSLQR